MKTMGMSITKLKPIAEGVPARAVWRDLLPSRR
jgi:hypothetical protein